MNSKISFQKLSVVFLIGVSISTATADVTFETPVYMPDMGADLAGDPVCIQVNGLLVSGCDGAIGPGVGSFSKSIHAITCVAQGGEISGDTAGTCSDGGTTVRTDGDSAFPCMVTGGATRTTYACHVDLPSGALIDQVTAFGQDTSSSGYFEAAIWRTLNTTFGASYISPTFGGTWQSSGVATSPININFPIYLAGDAPHIVDANHKYVIGFATKKPTGGVIFVYGFKIDYTILP